MYEHLLFEIKDSIAYITINNPKSLNALNTATLTELNKCLAQLEKRKDARVVIVTGSGAKAFVAGADISEMVNATSEEGRTMALLADEAFCRLERMPQVSIAAVNGYALGGGCELAMACDIRIAADSAVFGQPECGLGILPGFGGTQRLPRLIGKGRAKELIFTGDQIDAQEAYRLGLANHVVPRDELMETCRALGKKIASRASYAVFLAKTAINSSQEIDLKNGAEREKDLLGLAFATRDKQEGMEAFLARRPPRFQDF